MLSAISWRPVIKHRLYASPLANNERVHVCGCRNRLACIYIIRHPILTVRYDPDEKASAVLCYFLAGALDRKELSTSWVFHTGVALSKSMFNPQMLR